MRQRQRFPFHLHNLLQKADREARVIFTPFVMAPILCSILKTLAILKIIQSYRDKH